MTQLVSALIKFLSYVPFIKYLFKIYYLKSLADIKNEYKEKNNIIDVILTSSISSKDFIFGRSDLNFLIVVANECHPKAILKEFRSFVYSKFLLKLTVNHIYIPILTENEFNTDVVKSFLMRKSHKDSTKWESVLSHHKYLFYLRKQDRFAITYTGVQNLDLFFLKERAPKPSFSKTKNLIIAINTLLKFQLLSSQADTTWTQISMRLRRYPILIKRLSSKFELAIWSILTQTQCSHQQNKKYQDFPLEKELSKYFHSLLQLSFINDFTITPSLIQSRTNEIQGKLFIDIHINQEVMKKSYVKSLNHLISGIKRFENNKLKFRVRLTTDSLYQLQNEKALYPFPLEALYRKQKTYSVKKFHYNFLIQHDQIIHASIHFMIIQFMRFRSLQQKTELIGSKFIKSLNLMYKYYLLAEYLKGNEFKVELSEKKIREKLTPQFSEVSLDDVVTEEQWVIIKAQLIYLLKEIRDELAKDNQGLKVLRF
ncbi:MAG: hypothetical protein HON90_06735 [Halobacteriovoraceae bacterium]|jgi:hypothetical protein|nr:hypothetical protein [Halobacteriovoraceae bacterium]